MTKKKTDEIDICLENVLNLEDIYYQDGLKKGLENFKIEYSLEGQDYGFKQAIKVFFILGCLNGLILTWENQNYKLNNTMKEKLKELKENLSKLLISNDLNDIEKKIIDIKNKINFFSICLNENIKVIKMNDLIESFNSQSSTINDSSFNW